MKLDTISKTKARLNAADWDWIHSDWDWKVIELTNKAKEKETQQQQQQQQQQQPKEEKATRQEKVKHFIAVNNEANYQLTQLNASLTLN